MTKRKSKVAIRSILAIAILLPVFFVVGLCSKASAATNLQVVYDNWLDIEENEVQFYLDKINVTNAFNEGGVTLSSNLKIKKNVSGGNFSSNLIDIDSYYIYHEKDSSLTGETAKLKWKDAAALQDGTLLDVEMTIDNIIVYTNGYVGGHNNEVALLSDWTNPEDNTTRLHHSSYGGHLQYDVTVKVYRSGTSTQVTDKSTILTFVDIDGMEGYDCNSDSYIESVWIIGTLTDNKIHLMEEPTVSICNTSYGNNTRVIGTQGNDSTRESGFGVRYSVSNLKYGWTGKDRGTGIAFIDFFKVATSTSGPNADKGAITPTDDEVLWKENKKITVTPNSGYYVSRITVDGEEISFDKNSDGSVYFTFTSVTDNHKIDAQFATKESGQDNPNTGDNGMILFIPITCIVMLALGYTLGRITKRRV